MARTRGHRADADAGAPAARILGLDLGFDQDLAINLHLHTLFDPFGSGQTLKKAFFSGGRIEVSADAAVLFLIGIANVHADALIFFIIDLVGLFGILRVMVGTAMPQVAGLEHIVLQYFHRMPVGGTDVDPVAILEELIARGPLPFGPPDELPNSGFGQPASCDDSFKSVPGEGLGRSATDPLAVPKDLGEALAVAEQQALFAMLPPFAGLARTIGS